MSKRELQRHNYTRIKPFLVQKPTASLAQPSNSQTLAAPEPGTQSGPARWFGSKSLFSTFTTCRFGSWKGFGVCQPSEDVRVQALLQMCCSTQWNTPCSNWDATTSSKVHPGRFPSKTFPVAKQFSVGAPTRSHPAPYHM